MRIVMRLSYMVTLTTTPVVSAIFCIILSSAPILSSYGGCIVLHRKVTLARSYGLFHMFILAEE